MEQEIWLPVKDYEGVYEVSSWGRVKSLGRVNRRNQKLPERIMKPSKNPKGYLICTITKLNGERKAMSVHRLTITHFKENPKSLPQINHKDTIKTNNRIDNLEWCDGLYNMRHAWKNGIYIPMNGETNGMAKMTEESVLEMREMYNNSNLNQKEISEIFGMSHSVTNSILRRKTWKHI